MNFNTSLYSNALKGISKEFDVSEQAARCGAMIFLVTYAFGCELWAPWSEEFGRWPILQLSLFLVNIWQLPVALAPNFASIMVGPCPGWSILCGRISDSRHDCGHVGFGASTVRSCVRRVLQCRRQCSGAHCWRLQRGFLGLEVCIFFDTDCHSTHTHRRWSIWIQLIFGGFVQVLHFFFVPETRTTIMMNRIAKKRRKANPGMNIWGPDELVPFKERFSVREVLITWIRPFRMFLTEPIVLVLSLLSGFSDALIFMFIQSFALVYKQYNFSTVATGLSFIPIGIGYFIAWGLFIPAIRRNIKERAQKPDDEKAQYESRLYWLLFTAPCLPIGLFGFAWTILPSVHWIGSMIFSAIVGIANYSIYMATIDYMICAYGPYSASATGGNGWSRDFLAGVLTVPATPFFSNIGSNQKPPRNLEYANTILACVATVLVMAVYVIYWKGPQLRHRSPFAQQLASARKESVSRRVSTLPGLYGSRRGSKLMHITQLMSSF